MKADRRWWNDGRLESEFEAIRRWREEFRVGVVSVFPVAIDLREHPKDRVHVHVPMAARISVESARIAARRGAR